MDETTTVDAMCDAFRDARALLTAVATGDDEATIVVSEHMASPRLIATILAQWLAIAMANIREKGDA